MKVQLWHNNEGISPSWYLSRVLVTDLTSNNKDCYHFWCNRWLAAEAEDGKVDVEITCEETTPSFKKVSFNIQVTE